MSTNEFQIEFTYGDIPYIGLVNVLPKGKETWYTVNLESENQESYVEITVRPSKSALEDWDFECEDGQDATEFYDKDLLEEVGEAIEKYLLKGTSAQGIED